LRGQVIQVAASGLDGDADLAGYLRGGEIVVRAEERDD
jgi:hypothetical protein